MPTLVIEIVDGIAIDGFLPDAVIGTAYSAQLTGYGAVEPMVWSKVAGAWPPGWDIDPATGEVYGDADAAGSYAVTIRLQDVSGYWVTRGFSWRVVPVPLAIAGSFPIWTQGVAVTGSLTISGGAPPYSDLAVVAGALPAGVTLSIVGSSIVASGTPSGYGAWSATVQVQDSAGTPAQTNVTGDVVVPVRFEDVVLADGPRRYVRFAEASGTSLADIGSNATPGYISGSGYTRGATSIVEPIGTDYATIFSGSYTGAVLGPTLSITNDAYSLMVVARIPSAATGALVIPASGTASVASGSRDKMLYIDTSGRVIAGVWDGAIRAITGPVVDDGLARIYHLVCSPGDLSLYINGSIVGSTPHNSTDTTLRALHVAYSNLVGWPSAPGNVALACTIDEVAEFTVALSAGRVLAHAQAGGLA